MKQEDWDAMTPAQQSTYFQDIPHGTGRCCGIRDTLAQQLEDELTGVRDYSAIAGELGDKLAEKVRQIAGDEFGHYLIVRGIVDVLTQKCHCPKVDIKEFYEGV